MSGLAALRDAGAAARRRPGVLYRADAPHPGDDPPTAAALPWPPGTVIDLRSPREKGDREHPLAGPRTRVVDLPMSAALAPAVRARQRDGITPLAELYADAVDAAAGWLPALVAAAAHGTAPVLVHCAAGKDRTGVAVAVLLALAGVPRGPIEADHARSADTLDAVHARLGGAPRGPIAEVDPDAMAGVLDRLGGDPVGFAVAHGADPADVAAWARRLGGLRPREYFPGQ